MRSASLLLDAACTAGMLCDDLRVSEEVAFGGHGLYSVGFPHTRFHKSTAFSYSGLETRTRLPQRGLGSILDALAMLWVPRKARRQLDSLFFVPLRTWEPRTKMSLRKSWRAADHRSKHILLGEPRLLPRVFHCILCWVPGLKLCVVYLLISQD